MGKRYTIVADFRTGTSSVGVTSSNRGRSRSRCGCHVCGRVASKRGDISTFRTCTGGRFVSRPGGVHLLVIMSGLLANFSTPSTYILCVSGRVRGRGLFRTVYHIGHISNSSGRCNCVMSCRGLFRYVSKTVNSCASSKTTLDNCSGRSVRNCVGRGGGTYQGSLRRTGRRIRTLLTLIRPRAERKFFECFICSSGTPRRRVSGRLSSGTRGHSGLCGCIHHCLGYCTGLTGSLRSVKCDRTRHGRCTRYIGGCSTLGHRVRLHDGSRVSVEHCRPSVHRILSLCIGTRSDRIVTGLSSASFLSVITTRGRRRLGSLPSRLGSRCNETSTRAMRTGLHRMVHGSDPFGPTCCKGLSVVLRRLVSGHGGRVLSCRRCVGRLVRLMGGTEKGSTGSCPRSVGAPNVQTLCSGLKRGRCLTVQTRRMVGRGTLINFESGELGREGLVGTLTGLLKSRVTRGVCSVVGLRSRCKGNCY